ncbi:MAG TPA: hypothetical protein VFD94_09460 [Jatrophihabitans sp.]|nr:hypothetical protein [Jatrophihabitans sp.]
MAARRARNVGLTDEDVQRLRDQLAAGRRPRVQLSGPQFAAAPSATVVRIGDPALDGSDYLTVRVKVNGVLDELAFAPAELQLGGRRSAAGPPAAGPAATVSRRTGTPRAAGQRTGTGKPRTSPAPTSPPPTGQPSVPVAAPVPVATPTAVTAAVAGPEPTTASRSAAGRRRTPVTAAAVTFTVASAGDRWTVTASRGAKGIVKNAPVPPGVVTALAELLAQPALLDAVAEINQTALSQARARAEELRAELDRLEAVLATHRTPSEHRSV